MARAQRRHRSYGGINRDTYRKGAKGRKEALTREEWYRRQGRQPPEDG